MSTPYLNMETLNWFLFDVFGLENLTQYPRFADYDKQAFIQFLDSVKKMSDAELEPIFREMDAHPARYQDGGVVVHQGVRTIIERTAELGILGATLDHADGGIQLPFTLYQGVQYIIDAANNHVSGYPGLTSGAAGLIATFGTPELKAYYLPPMLAGTWSGTMALTEPQAGSSLSDITTSATPRDDGGYDIRGQKIWISGGDHQYSENFVHLLLGRIDGAPPGTKGISLFVVPKFREGNVPNDVVCAGDFQKMGQRGYCTTHLVFGEKNDCRGWLVGQPHQGLAHMFLMMNGARISVGRHGAAIATAAYYASLQFAKERPQGRRMLSGGKKPINQDQTLIINHADVRRMLFTQKAIAEGSLALILQASLYHDMEKVSSGEEAEKYNLLLELLTPMVKTFPSEAGRRAVDQGLQLLGGAGFCDEYVLQVYYRDIRIMAIYEGTTGIQSIDLLGRKITMANGKAMAYLQQEIQTTLSQAQNHPELQPYAQLLAAQLKLNESVITTLAPLAFQGEHERFLADATLYMDFLCNIVVAWLWLKISVQALAQTPTDFHRAKVQTMKFFYKYELSRNTSLAETLTNLDTLTIVGDTEFLD